MKRSRPIQESDLGAVHEILRSSESEGWGVSGQWTFRQLHEETQVGKSLVGIDSFGVVTAFITARQVGDEWEITNLGVHPRVRRTGWMSFLLQEFLNTLRANEKVFLEVHEKNVPAQALYGKLGFQFSGSRKNYYPDGGNALLFGFTKN